MTYTTSEKEKIHYVILPDECPDDPSRWLDREVHYAFFHRKYSLNRNFKIGNIHDDFDAFERFRERECGKGKYAFIPVYMYDHSGLAFSFGSFNDHWDSGLLGFIWYNIKRLKKSYAIEDEEKLEGAVKAEAEQFFAYVSGDTYCYEVRDEEGNVLDACGGFYLEKDAEECAKESLESVRRNSGEQFELLE